MKHFLILLLLVVIERFHYNFSIQSMQTVQASFAGKKINVPIFNGIAPIIEIRNVNGVEQRDYFYEKFKYDSKKELIYKTPAEKNEEQIKNLKKEIDNLKSDLEKFKKTNIKKEVVPSHK